MYFYIKSIEWFYGASVLVPLKFENQIVNLCDNIYKKKSSLCFVLLPREGTTKNKFFIHVIA